MGVVTKVLEGNHTQEPEQEIAARFGESKRWRDVVKPYRSQKKIALLFAS